MRLHQIRLLQRLRTRVNEFSRFRRVFLGRGVVVFGMVIIILFIIVAIFAPLIAPYDPYKLNLSAALLQPSAQHWLGTDPLGRDTLSRIIYGTRTSLEIGLIVVAVASVVGMALGTIAGYYGGWTYNIIMRVIDALMAFPMILLALVIAALLGNRYEKCDYCPERGHDARICTVDVRSGPFREGE